MFLCFFLSFVACVVLIVLALLVAALLVSMAMDGVFFPVIISLWISGAVVAFRGYS